MTMRIPSFNGAQSENVAMELTTLIDLSRLKIKLSLFQNRRVAATNSCEKQERYLTFLGAITKT